MLARRLQRLPRRPVLGHDVAVAASFQARLLGLAGLDREATGGGLLLAPCAGVHTFGMRFALDLVFLDREGRPLDERLALPPRRFAWCRGAAAVLELPAQGGEFGTPRDWEGACCRNERRSPASSSARTTR